MRNHRFLISVMSKQNHSLVNKLNTLARLNSPKMLREYNLIDAQNHHNCLSVYDYPLEVLLFEPIIQNEIRTNIRPFNNDNMTLVAPHIVTESISSFERNSVLYTDGSRSREGTGCAVFHHDNFELKMKLSEPSGVFTAELSAILLALHHIKTHNSGNFLIVTDSMSSILAIESQRISMKTHPLVLKCKESLWWLINNDYLVELTWAPAHVGVTGNERADRLAKEAVLSDIPPIFPPIIFDHIPQIKTNLILANKMGRFVFSVRPTVFLDPWVGLRNLLRTDRQLPQSIG
jgi:ribonuclease HI